MQVYELPIETKASSGYTHKVTLDHNDLTDATTGNSQTITLITVPTTTIVKDLATRVVTSFQKTGTSAYNTNTIVVGVSGTTNQLLASQQINTNGTTVVAKGFGNTAPIVYTASTAIIATVASMTGYSLADLDAGEIHIFLNLTTLSSL
jgi:hypothetical protein